MRHVMAQKSDEVRKKASAPSKAERAEAFIQSFVNENSINILCVTLHKTGECRNTHQRLFE
jgi:hypothetical protein